MISVICSNYNSDEWIDGYLHAIQNQTLPKFEIIFVDAASTDHSLLKIQAFKFRQGIAKKVIAKSTKIGIYEAWNIAIEAASGDYVVNCNTDDRLYPDALLIYQSYTEAYPQVDIFYGPHPVVDDKEHKHIVRYFNWPEYSHAEMLRHCICGPFPLLKKATVIEEGLFDPEFTICGDYELWARMSKHGRNFMRIPEDIGTYYLNPIGMSTNPKNAAEHIRQDREIQRRYA